MFHRTPSPRHLKDGEHCLSYAQEGASVVMNWNPTDPTDPTAPSGTATLGEALAEKIEDLLYARGWTERQLAEHLGISQSTVNLLLNGKRRAKMLDFIEQLAQDLFKMRPSELLADLEARKHRLQLLAQERNRIVHNLDAQTPEPQPRRPRRKPR